MSGLSRTYFVTGATGFLAQEYLRHAAADPDVTLYCLVRASPVSGSAQARLEAVTASAGFAASHAQRIIAVPGDLRRPNLGLAAVTLDMLAQEVDRVVHCAADVSFLKPLPALRRVNVEGTRRVIDFANRCRQQNPRFSHLSYVSTAFVAGKRRGVVREDDISDAYGFKNNYERSKFEAELLVREAASDLPTMIFRPSVVAGATADGKARSGNVIYPALEAAVNRKPNALCLRRSARLDVVPVDYVARAMLHIERRSASRGKCFHVVAGWRRAVGLDALLDLIRSEFGQRTLVVPHWLYQAVVRPILCRLRTPAARKLLLLSDAYHPYMTDGPLFDDRRAASALADSSLRFPDSREFVRRVLRYAIASDFGRTQVAGG